MCRHNLYPPPTTATSSWSVVSGCVAPFDGYLAVRGWGKICWVGVRGKQKQIRGLVLSHTRGDTGGVPSAESFHPTVDGRCGDVRQARHQVPERRPVFMTRRVRVVLACVLLVGTGGCSDPLGLDTQKQALDLATADVRQSATKVLNLLQTSLGTRPLKDSVNEVVANMPSWELTVLSSSTGPADSFVADLAILGGGVAGGGLSYKEVIVRVCVRYSGKLGVDPQVNMADVACPAGLPSTNRGSSIERTVTLK